MLNPQITRREFLKLVSTGTLAYALKDLRPGRALAAASPKQGRITWSGIPLYDAPNFNANKVHFFGNDQVVEITAERFSFTPSLVRTTVGKVVEFRVESEDTMHGFRILGTDINVEIPKRGKGPAVVRYTPKEPGKVIFECSHTCGAGHAFMRGEIVVGK